MTKLEEEIVKAMESADRESSKRFSSEDYAKAASEVAKRYIEKALRDGTKETFSDNSGKLMTTVQNVYVKQWMFENGIE